MIYKKLYIQIIVRVFFILITCYLLAHELIRTDHIFTFINLGILLIIQIIFLIRYLNRTNKNLTAFLNSVKSGDQADLLNTLSQSKAYSELNNCLNEINAAIQRIKIENQVQWEYFQIVVEHVGVGIISYDQYGKIELFNNAAKHILGLRVLNNLEQLHINHPSLHKKLESLQPGIQETIKIKLNESSNDYALNTTKSIFNERVVTIASLQNINKPLDAKEIESYQKLIRVLTHEIMNSVAPISSLTGSLASSVRLKQKQNKPLDDQLIKKTLDGLSIIEKRSKGLSDFVNKFRSVSVLKPISPSPSKVTEIIENVLPLFSLSLEERNIQLQSSIPKEMEIYVDRGQMEQVIINLIKNAIEALEKTIDKHIRIIAREEAGKKIIEIHDNGTGISEEEVDKIFIPFYTTKKEGSGIGLSLSKQIMMLHGGTISISSEINKGTIVKILFP